MKFNVGDQVRIIWSGTPERVGIVTTILGSCPCPETCASPVDCYELSLLHVSGSGTNAHYRERHLKLIYDGNVPASWDDCVWQPDRCTV